MSSETDRHQAEQNPHDSGRLEPEETTCAKCRQKVGLIWYRGRSTLFNGPIETDGAGRLIVQRHTCEPYQPPDLGPVRHNGRVRR